MNQKGILNKINQVRALLKEIEGSLNGEPVDQDTSLGQATISRGESAEEKPESPEGKTGVFEGESVIINEKKYQVPPNYASKSRLVIGDKLKLIKLGDYNEFKLEEEVPRASAEGILTKKENQWVVLVNNVEFRVISAAIRFYEGEIGDKVELVLPQGYEQNPPIWAAVQKILKPERKDKLVKEKIGQKGKEQFAKGKERKGSKRPTPEIKGEISFDKDQKETLLINDIPELR